MPEETESTSERDESDRATTRNWPLVGVGVTFTALGSLSLFAGLFSVLATAGKSNDDTEQAMAIGFFVGGACALGAGIPMIVVGTRRRPVDDRSEARLTLEATFATLGQAPAAGLSLKGTF